MKSKTPYLDEITGDEPIDIPVIENNNPAIITTTTGLDYIATLLRYDSRKGTALLRRDNPDGTYSIISVTNIMAIEQIHSQADDSVVHPQ